ncbi:MAG: JmjC domain-containing protein [Clostridia bacterium]
MKLELLGGLTARSFLRRHWQKRPLFVRRALPGFRGATSLRELRRLAARDDVESRIAVRARRALKFTQGPVEYQRVFPARDWTILVSGVNLHVAAADRLLRRFAFLPQARLDDVMVSYAAPGGGVGPHVDSYDVFLVQGAGRRRWRVWTPGKKSHGEFICEAGDLLYLPPGWPHDGIALEPCFTYSVGFRAPKGRELAARFLDWLHERGLPDASYSDPGLAPTSHPAALPRDMVRFAKRLVDRIRWSEKDAASLLGEYLSEPKPHVVFAPRRAAAPLGRASVRLDAKTQLLYAGEQFFLNGERLRLRGRDAALARELADRRAIAGARLARSRLRDLVYDWRAAGYLHFERPA